MKISCLIVDDEELALNVLRSYIEKVPFLRLEASTSSPFEAIEILNNRTIDLVFLDIEMPGLSGIELVGSMEPQPAFIFVTAYREYAADAFDLDTVDYLVKPVSFTRFLKAVNKYRAHYTGKSTDKKAEIQLRADRKTFRIEIGSILYIEGLKDYVKVYIEAGRVLIVKETMAAMIKKLESYHFIRCHKSYSIAVPHVTAFSTEHVEIGDKQIPIGRNYRDGVLRELSG